MPATPRLERRTWVALGVQPDQGGVADRVGGAEHQLVTAAAGRGDRGSHVQAGGQRMGGQLCADRVDRAAFASAQRRSHSGSGVPVVTARVPVAWELPDTSGQRGPVVSAKTGSAGSATASTPGGAASAAPA